MPRSRTEAAAWSAGTRRSLAQCGDQEQQAADRASRGWHDTSAGLRSEGCVLAEDGIRCLVWIAPRRSPVRIWLAPSRDAEPARALFVRGLWAAWGRPRRSDFRTDV